MSVDNYWNPIFEQCMERVETDVILSEDRFDMLAKVSQYREYVQYLEILLLQLKLIIQKEYSLLKIRKHFTE
jgi:hypothetical protein